MTLTTHAHDLGPSFFSLSRASPFCPLRSSSCSFIDLHFFPLPSHLFIGFFISLPSTTHRARIHVQPPTSFFSHSYPGHFKRFSDELKALILSTSVSALNYIDVSLCKVLLLSYITLCFDDSIVHRMVKKGGKALYGRERR